MFRYRTLRAATVASAALVLLASAGACKKEHADGEEAKPPPTRAEDMARDAGEKPQQVMDALEIGPGSTVADVIAGGGYYTYLLDERVGPTGTVYATAAEGVTKRLAEGDMKGKTNVKVVKDVSEIPAGTLDAVLINRAYHLIGKPGESFFPALQKALKPGGRIGIIEVRLNAPTGHDMKTHRMGQQTVEQEVEAGGFTLVEASELLANPDDPRTDFMEGKRHLADRMFLIFEKPAPATAAR
jgi:predicted methyltransferase